MGKDKADKNPSKRLRENGSQSDEDDEHVGLGGAMSARLEWNEHLTRSSLNSVWWN